jgi:hypothetical protein
MDSPLAGFAGSLALIWVAPVADGETGVRCNIHAIDGPREGQRLINALLNGSVANDLRAASGGSPCLARVAVDEIGCVLKPYTEADRLTATRYLQQMTPKES